MTSVAEIDEVELHDARIRSVHLLRDTLVVIFSHCVAYSPHVDGEHSHVWFCGGRLQCGGVRSFAAQSWALSQSDYVYSERIEGADGEATQLSQALNTWLPAAKLTIAGYGGELVVGVERIRMTLSRCQLTRELL